MLDGLFRPRSVAVVGASNNPFSIGNIVIRNLAAHGFKGPIFPINPKERAIRSFKCFKSVLDVPDEVDLVNISVNYNLVPGVLTECGKKGVKFCIVHTAGFKEVGAEGIKREREMVALAHSLGMRIFGPNSQGIQNSDPEVSVYANFTFVPMKPGNISVIAQGGGMGELLKLHLHKAGLGHRLYCSYGNEADLTMPELLAYYGEDPGTKAIMMQIESFKDPAAFLEVASRITPRKPILAIKAGRTREGSVAVSSHTGTLVDQAAMATALFRKAGVVEFSDSEQMIKTGIALSTQDPPKGNRIGMITNTGGPGIQMTDESVDRGLVLAKWSEAGYQKLKASLYAEASLGNPVDVVATGGPEHYQAAVETLLAEEGVDMVLVFFVTAPFVNLDEIAKRIREAVSKSKKPVAMVVETIPEYGRLIELLRGAGLPVYEFAEDGARSLAAMWRHTKLAARPREEPPALPVDRAAAEAIVARYSGKNAYLTQADAFAVLAAYGVPVPRLAVVPGPDGLATAARAVGFPCVLKVDAADVVHKSDEGGVVLDIGDPETLAAAYRTMHDRFAARGARFLLMEQKAPGREVIVGVSESPGLGSLVMFGLGGVFVEVMRDVAFAVAPLSRPEAREMMAETKGYRILTGMRGQAGVDLEALEELVLRVSRLAADFPAIVEMDLNPVFAYPKGTAPAAVDVRMKVR
ncbi:MAG: acetate--CoA ligase family protein [Planctomycetes bacterium]|jgi:acetyltransferase|nr:acetate--CoA ligase family protein [Planctomycetota bacterium]